MNETLTTVRGTIVTDPVVRRYGDDPVVRCRVASNIRYRDRETGEWRTSGTLYFSATCWGALAERIGGRLAKGDAVLVQGRLQTNEYETDGVRRSDLEMRVTAIGPDMSRMDVTVRRRPSDADGTAGSGVAGGSAEGRPGDDTDPFGHAPDVDPGDGDDDPAESVAPGLVGAGAGPLGASPAPF